MYWLFFIVGDVFVTKLVHELQEAHNKSNFTLHLGFSSLFFPNARYDTFYLSCLRSTDNRVSKGFWISPTMCFVLAVRLIDFLTASDNNIHGPSQKANKSKLKYLKVETCVFYCVSTNHKIACLGLHPFQVKSINNIFLFLIVDWIRVNVMELRKDGIHFLISCATPRRKHQRYHEVHILLMNKIFTAYRSA